MSQEYAGQDPIKIAQQAERDLNSHTAKHGQNADISSNHGHGASDSSAFILESNHLTTQMTGS